MGHLLLHLAFQDEKYLIPTFLSPEQWAIPSVSMHFLILTLPVVQSP